MSRISWKEAESTFTHVVTFTEKLELLKGIDDGVGLINEAIRLENERLARWMLDNREALDFVKRQPKEDQRFLVGFMLQMAPEEIRKNDERLKELRLMKELLSSENKSKNYLNAREDREKLIQRIKKIPIESLVVLQKVRRTPARIQACCPLHIDKTPSFTIFRGDNNFKCWGCNKGGDVIAFWMALNNCSFNAAIEALGETHGQRNN